MTERLHFNDGIMSYDPALVSEHLVRYHCVRDLCRGARVLDVACGEGYGSALLAEWGAAEVVGIDISAEAIAVARQKFNRPSLRFLAGDACRLPDVLGDAAAFDLIVSFETIEHVPDAAALLSGMRQYSAPDATVVISCPNDHVEQENNPFHLRRYTFDEFRASTTAVLGSASGWLLGTPAQGEILYRAGDAAMENSTESGMLLALQCQDLGRAAAIPAQCNIAPNVESCRFYLGFWGGSVTTDAVVSPQSVLAFKDVWRTLAWLKQEVAACRQEQAGLAESNGDLRAAKAGVEQQLADLRRRVIVQARVAQEGTQKIEAELLLVSEECERVGAELRQAHAVRVRLQEELQQAHAELERWAAFRRSLGYRLVLRYQHIYGWPLIGPILRGLRRIAGTTRRGLSRR